jgi:hypothetical protein
LIDDQSIDINSNQRMIVGTDSDKDEDLACYMKQREKLNQGTHRSTSLSAKTT